MCAWDASKPAGADKIKDSDNNIRLNNDAIEGVLGSAVLGLAYTPSFLAQPTAIQENFAVGEEVTVVFGTEVFDIGTNFAANTFTAPVTGKYLLTFIITLTNMDSASAYYVVRLVTTARTYIAASVDPRQFAADVAGGWSLSGSIVTDMAVTNTAHLTVKQQAGDVQTDIGTSSWFSGVLVA